MTFFDDIFGGISVAPAPRRRHQPIFPVLPTPPPAPIAAPVNNPFRIPIAPKKKKEKTASDVFIEHIVERTGEVVQEVVEEVGAPIRHTAEAIEQGVNILTGSSDPTTRETMEHTEPAKKKKSTVTDTTDEDRTEATEERPVDTRPAGGTTVPDGPVHDNPVDNTGENVPDCERQSGNALLANIGEASCHRRNVDPTASGGGSHSGQSGSKTHAGAEGVDSFDSGGKPKPMSFRLNPVRQMLININAMKNPYGDFRTCKSNKKLVQ